MRLVRDFDRSEPLSLEGLQAFDILPAGDADEVGGISVEPGDAPFVVDLGRAAAKIAQDPMLDEFERSAQLSSAYRHVAVCSSFNVTAPPSGFLAFLGMDMAVESVGMEIRFRSAEAVHITGLSPAALCDVWELGFLSAKVDVEGVLHGAAQALAGLVGPQFSPLPDDALGAAVAAVREVVDGGIRLHLAIRHHTTRVSASGVCRRSASWEFFRSDRDTLIGERTLMFTALIPATWNSVPLEYSSNATIRPPFRARLPLQNPWVPFDAPFVA